MILFSQCGRNYELLPENSLIEIIQDVLLHIFGLSLHGVENATVTPFLTLLPCHYST
jgi:hypothetical protein